MQITLLQPWKFRSSYSYRTINTECESCQFIVNVPVEPQMSNIELAQNMENTVKKSGSFLRML